MTDFKTGTRAFCLFVLFLFLPAPSPSIWTEMAHPPCSRFQTQLAAVLEASLPSPNWHIFHGLSPVVIFICLVWRFPLPEELEVAFCSQDWRQPAAAVERKGPRCGLEAGCQRGWLVSYALSRRLYGFLVLFEVNTVGFVEFHEEICLVLVAVPPSTILPL